MTGFIMWACVILSVINAWAAQEEFEAERYERAQIMALGSVWLGIIALVLKP